MCPRGATCRHQGPPSGPNSPETPVHHTVRGPVGGARPTAYAGRVTSLQQPHGRPSGLSGAWRHDARAMLVALVVLELLILGVVLWRATLPAYGGPVGPLVFVTGFDLFLVFLISRGRTLARIALMVIAVTPQGSFSWVAWILVALAVTEFLVLLSPALRALRPTAPARED